jgi:hypothetical protein
VLGSLGDDPALALEVLGKLGNAVFGGITGQGSSPAIEVLEEHVPWLLRAGQRREALRAVQILDSIVRNQDRTESLHKRADIALRRIGRTNVMRSLLTQLKSTPGGDPETEELIYLLGSRSVARLLEELRDADERTLRLDLVDIFTVVGRMARAHGDDPDQVLAPLKLVLIPAAIAPPWYLVRNVVLVLGNVGTPNMRQELEVRLDQEQDSRILSEVALGLMNSASQETLELLGKSLLGGRLASPEAFRGLLPGLLKHGKKGTFKGIENLLRSGALDRNAVQVCQSTLIHELGQEAEAFLRRVLFARQFLSRRLIFSEEVRLATVDALAGVEGDWLDGLLERADKDPSQTVRARIAALRKEDATTGVQGAILDHQVD